MRAVKLKAEVDNAKLRDTLKTLKRADVAIRKRACNRAQRENARLVLGAARGFAPVELPNDALSEARTGLYLRSLGSKVKAYANGTVIVIVGARRGFRKKIGTRQRGKNKGAPIYYDPAKVAHLIERGTSHSRAEPHLRPAIQQTKGGVIDNTIRAVRDVLQESGVRL